MKAFVSVFVAAIFVILGMANAAILSLISNAVTTPIDLGQNAIYSLNGISGGVAPYTFNAYFTNAKTPATNVFIGSNTFAPSATSKVITLEISNATSSTNTLIVTAYNGLPSTSNFLFANTITVVNSSFAVTPTTHAYFSLTNYA